MEIQALQGNLTGKNHQKVFQIVQFLYDKCTFFRIYFRGKITLNMINNQDVNNLQVLA